MRSSPHGHKSIPWTAEDPGSNLISVCGGEVECFFCRNLMYGDSAEICVMWCIRFDQALREELGLTDRTDASG